MDGILRKMEYCIPRSRVSHNNLGMNDVKTSHDHKQYIAHNVPPLGEDRPSNEEQVSFVAGKVLLNKVSQATGDTSVPQYASVNTTMKYCSLLTYN